MYFVFSVRLTGSSLRHAPFEWREQNSVRMRGEQKLSVVRSEVCEPRRSGEAAQNYIMPLEVSCRYKVGFNSWYATISYPNGKLEVREKKEGRPCHGEALRTILLVTVVRRIRALDPGTWSGSRPP